MNFFNTFHTKISRASSLMVLLFLTAIWVFWSTAGYKQSLHEPHMSVAAVQPCIVLKPEIGPYQESVIWQSGIYCIGVDFWQESLSNGAGHSGPAEYRQLVAVRASDVAINLVNHILHSDGHSSGIDIGVDENKQIKGMPRVTIIGSNVIIKNGVIDLRGLGVAVNNHNNWRMLKIDERAPENFNGYKKSRVIIENILIKTDNIGVVLEGDGNIIRNCIIQSGGTAAITMAGPNGQIRNNSIVLTAPFIPGSMQGTHFDQTRQFTELFEARREPKAAIALHQATGTIISGNRIEVRGKSPTRHNIYLADASTDVRIEGNTFVGAEDPVTLLKGSTAILKNNVLEPRKPWWKF